MTHLTREELQRWWDDGRPADRARVVSHLAECDACGALFGEVIDAQPLAADPARTPASGLRERAYGTYRPSSTAAGRRWLVPALAGAAAAVLVLAIGLPMLREPPAPAVGDEGTVRGTSLQPLSPIGSAAPPVEFRWASPVAAARFVVDVRDADERQVFQLTSDRESARLPPERLALLTPGRPYTWVVVAYASSGEEIMRAPPRSFVLASPSR
jgi:hypothetical protein